MKCVLVKEFWKYKFVKILWINNSSLAYLPIYNHKYRLMLKHYNQSAKKLVSTQFLKTRHSCHVHKLKWNFSRIAAKIHHLVQILTIIHGPKSFILHLQDFFLVLQLLLAFHVQWNNRQNRISFSIESD